MALTCRKKKLLALLRGITTECSVDFYLNCLHSPSEQKANLNPVKVFLEKIFFWWQKDTEDTAMFVFKQYLKCIKAPYMVYTDVESLIERIDGWKNNPDQSSTTKTGECIPCEYSVSMIQAFDSIGNNGNVCRSEIAGKTICESLREYTIKIKIKIKIISKLGTIVNILVNEGALSTAYVM